MLAIPIKNSSGTRVRIQTEPWADVKDMNPGDECILKGDFGDDLNKLAIEICEDNTILIFVPDNAEIT